ncbi:MAG: protein phosphatase 2C domain-containing protein [Acidobacteriota bacterium]|nr:protein phosphatase 2C domain-containing protein [Blastocatellia bacterium]MDW8411373.1 protein phosphatase 2C domain-containing protein [Acidobacteriota bacterium]
MYKKLEVAIAACTDKGVLRKSNEDAFLAADLKTGQSLADGYNGRIEELLLAVSDGMGGQRRGDIASQMTLQCLLDTMLRISSKTPAYERLVTAVENTNHKVFAQSNGTLEYAGMGATLTAAFVTGDKCYVAEVGDSRAYLLRQNRIKLLTTDQSMLQVFVSRGLITEEEAAKSSYRSLLLQAIGTKDEIEVAVTSFALRTGDCLLLCSDGLSNKLSEADMLRLATQYSLTDAAKKMVQLANERGGEDNITVLLARLTGEGLKGEERLTKTFKVLSSFDPDRPKQRKQTERLVSAPQQSNLIFANTVGLADPNRTLSDYEQIKQLHSDFEQLSYHLDEATLLLESQIRELKLAANWLQQGGAIDKRLTEIIIRLKNTQTNLEQTRKTVKEAKEVFEKI